MASSQMLAIRSRASQLSRRLADTQSPVKAATDGAVFGAAALSAGYADGKLPSVNGLRPSQIAGVASIAIGAVTGSGTAIRAGAGALANTLYMAGFAAATGEKDPK